MRIEETETYYIIEMPRNRQDYTEIQIKKMEDGVETERGRLKGTYRRDVLRWLFSKKRFTTINDIHDWIIEQAGEAHMLLASATYHDNLRWRLELITMFYNKLGEKIMIGENLVARAPSDPEEKERVLRRLQQIAENMGVRFRRERVKWEYYDLFKREGADAFAAPWEMAYPIDREHIRAALAYWGQAENRQFYNARERQIITERIVRAALKYGIKVRYNPAIHKDLPDSLKKKLQAMLIEDQQRKLVLQMWALKRR